jgi:signal transduction histidine kinase
LKSVFAKVFGILIIVLIISFSVTAVLLSAGIDRLISGQRSDQLRIAAEKIEDGLTEYLTDDSGFINTQLFISFIQAISENTSSMIWIVRNDGAIIMYSYLPDELLEYMEVKQGRAFLPDERQYKLTGDADPNAYLTGDFYGLFKDTGMDWVTVMEPFRITNIAPHNTRAEGMILVHCQVPSIQKSRSSILSIFLISGGIGVLLALLLAFILSKRLIKPLKIMKTAAKRIASGEFTERIGLEGKDEIAELSQSFDNMVVALQNLEAMRRDFIGNVSHELRTPITTIKGFIEGILDGVIPQEKHAYYLSIVRDEVGRMQGLVNNLLDLARMQAGETALNITVFDINELVRRCVINLQQMLIEKNLDFKAEFETERLFVSADRDAIQRAMINLLHNAIKFTDCGGSITVRTMEKDGVTVMVEDTGKGIPANELPYVFERFYKADKSRGMDKSGVGLGLAIVKNIILAHGQSIKVDSQEGRGTCFTFTLNAGAGS